MRIFGVGLHRTGTRSLAAALERLGITTAHDPTDPETQRCIRRVDPKWAVLETHMAVCDMPVCIAMPELYQAWPGSKAILTVRNWDSWLESVERHYSKPLRTSAAKQRRGFLSQSFYGCTSFHAGRFIRKAQEYQSMIIETIPPHEMLILDVSSHNAWSQLCTFLGKEIPDDGPFPHIKDKQWLPQKSVS